MGNMLDILGSIAIGGMVILLLITVTLQFSERTSNTRVSEMTSFTIAETGKIIEEDFSKLGYRLNGASAIVSMDSISITFNGDLDNDGSTERITYSASTISGQLNLVRTVTDQAGSQLSYWITPINNLVLTYFNANNTETNIPANVRGIDFSFSLQNKETDATTEIGAFWNKRMFPKNLNN